MARRLPSSPPVLAGFSYVRVLGSGGFADVFLYEQSMPRRAVAVKVLLAELVTDCVRQMFKAEANLMAQLSSHPSVLTVFQAGVSADGRPYLVMEYCSSTLSQRYRTRPLDVPDVLRIGVRISSAIEAAHRAGVLHRDIKPSNILTTAYGHPVLSDFGIAATVGQTEQLEAVGLSIPWSAPEVLSNDISGSIASEVWSIGATLYTLLAGRSPFEITGAENSPRELVTRINKAKPGPIGRADVPARLEQLLVRCLSRRPESRPASALELIRELQAVESEMGLTQTAIELAVEDWVTVAAPDESDRTQLSAARAVNIPPARRTRRQPAGPLVSAPATYSGSAARTGNLRGSSSKTGAASALRANGRRVGLLVTVAALALLIGAAGTFALLRNGSDDIPTVRGVAATVTDGSAVFTWDDPGMLPGDRYFVRSNDGESSIQREPEFIQAGRGLDRVCITVAVNRAGSSGAQSTEKCVELGESP